MKHFFIILGFIFITLSSFFFIRYFEYKDLKQEKKLILEKILEGEEYLKRHNKKSIEKSIEIFSKLKSKNVKFYYFRIRYNLARSLEKNGERLLALKIYRKLNQSKNLMKEEKIKNNLALGNLLLLLNRNTEGIAFLKSVITRSSDKNIRSQAFLFLGNYYFKKRKYQEANKNYKSSLEENYRNSKARVYLGETLKKLGKKNYYEAIYDDYIKSSAYFDPDGKKITTKYKITIFESGRKAFINKKYYKAIRYFKKALNLGVGLQREEEAFYYIAESYRFVKNYKNSILFLNKILTNKIYSLDQTALYKKGLIAFEKGNYRRAASLFQKTNEKNPITPIGKIAIDWRKESVKMIEDNLQYEKEKKRKKRVPTEQIKIETEPVPLPVFTPRPLEQETTEPELIDQNNLNLFENIQNQNSKKPKDQNFEKLKDQNLKPPIKPIPEELKKQEERIENNPEKPSEQNPKKEQEIVTEESNPNNRNILDIVGESLKELVE